MNTPRAASVCVAACAGTLLAAAGLGGPANAADGEDGSTSGIAECSIMPLPLPDDLDQGAVLSGSSDGSYLVGWGTTAGSDVRVPLLWHDGEVEAVGLDGREEVAVTAVDDEGNFAGFWEENSVRKSFANRGGEVMELPSLDQARSSTATSISKGVVAGVSGIGEEDRGVMWDVDAPDSIDWMPTPDGFEGSTRVNDLSEDATFVGVAGEMAYAWGYGGGRYMELPSLKETVERSEAAAISGDYVVGEQTVVEGDELSTSVLWNLADGTVEELPAELSASPEAGVDVSGEGIVAGTVYEGGNRAVMIEDGEVTFLPGFDDGPSGATTISADGVIAGYAADMDSGNRPATWTGCR